MRIITVNLSVSDLEEIEKLTGNKGLYPSRSELIRVAVRDYLISELETAKIFEEYQKRKNESKSTIIEQKISTIEQNAVIDVEEIIKIPTSEKEGIMQYKTYKVKK